MRLLGDRVSRRTAWKLAREHDWSVLGEAEYLAVTRLQADALVTVDPSLASAARDVAAVAAIDDLLAPGQRLCGLPVQGGCGCGDGFRVGRGPEQIRRARLGHLPGVGPDEGQRPALPRVVVLPCGCMDPGVDQLLYGAAAKKVAALAFGGQDVGASSDAELRCSRPGKPDAVREADLVVGGQVNGDRLGDAAGCGAEAACGDGPDGAGRGSRRRRGARS
jgi:hypothetical protein